MNEFEKGSIVLSRKQMAIIGIIALVIFVPVVAFLLSLGQVEKSSSNSINPTPVQPITQVTAVSPTPVYKTSLLSFKQLSAGSTAVVIETGAKPASAVQLEIGFDPVILKNIQVVPGSFFDKSLVLLSNVDYQKGSIFFAVVTPPDGKPIRGKGTVAVVSYTFAQGAINPTTLQFLSRTKVATVGIDDSILKLANNITISATNP